MKNSGVTPKRLTTEAVIIGPSIEPALEPAAAIAKILLLCDDFRISFKTLQPKDMTSKL